MQRFRCSLQNPKTFVTSSWHPSKVHLLVFTSSLLPDFSLFLNSFDFLVASCFISFFISSILSNSSWLAWARRNSCRFESIATLWSPMQLPPLMFLWRSVWNSCRVSSITVNVVLFSLEIFNLKQSNAYEGNVWLSRTSKQGKEKTLRIVGWGPKARSQQFSMSSLSPVLRYVVTALFRSHSPLRARQH